MPKGVDNPLILNQDTPEGIAARSCLFELFTNFCPVRFKKQVGIRMGSFYICTIGDGYARIVFFLMKVGKEKERCNGDAQMCDIFFGSDNICSTGWPRLSCTQGQAPPKMYDISQAHGAGRNVVQLFFRMAAPQLHAGPDTAPDVRHFPGARGRAKCRTSIFQDGRAGSGECRTSAFRAFRIY
jgi:hypothetical protein